MSTLGIRIKKQRLNVNLTQEELAMKLGYKSKSSINKIENGENDLPQSKINLFANALKTTPAYLMGWTDDNSFNYSEELIDSNNISKNYYGDHQANLGHLSDKPDLLQLYKEIHNSENLKLLFDSARELSPEDLEMILVIIKGIKAERGK